MMWEHRVTPSSRTADQTEIALFWNESSPLKWSRIARTVSINKRLDMWENARLLGLINMALADGYIAMVATKNHYNYWRPVTAIQAGATDGNPDTTGDRSWTSLRPTPPDQDYASGRERADQTVAELAPIIAELRAGGITSLRAIAATLNERGNRTLTGSGRWHHVQVGRLLARLPA
jgi:hypothetical protein